MVPGIRRIAGLVRLDRAHRYVEPASDRLGDAAERDPLVIHGVQARARRRGLERKR
jgi:hypothetical protein